MQAEAVIFMAAANMLYLLRGKGLQLRQSMASQRKQRSAEGRLRDLPAHVIEATLNRLDKERRTHKWRA